MRSLRLWLGMSVALHVALGAGVWASVRTTRISTAQTPSTAALVVSLVEASNVRSTPRRVLPAKRAGFKKPSRIAPTTRVTSPVDAVQADDRPPTTPDPGPALLNQRGSIDEGSTKIHDALDGSSPQEGAADFPNAFSPQPVAQTDTAAGASAAVDHYRPLVLAILERAKRYPPLAQRWGLEGTVEIAFTIAQDGRLSEARVVATSRHSVLDDATLDMVRRIGSLPPPPDQNPLRFAASIQYTLDAGTPSASTKGATP